MSAADLATFMGADPDSLTAPLVNLALTAAQAEVRGYLDQKITLVEDDTVLLDGTGTRKLRLPERPVRAVTTVTDVTDDANPEEITNYVIRRSILYRPWDETWPRGQVNIEVTYDHGWDVTPDLLDDDTEGDEDADDRLSVPADIVLVTLSAARRGYALLGVLAPATGVITSETIGSYSYSIDAESAKKLADGVALVSVEKLILDNYKIKGSG